MSGPVVRLRGAKGPTPYLRQQAGQIHCVRRHTFQAVDLACGDGRNSVFLLELGACVTSLDLQADYSGALEWQAGTPVPRANNSVDLVLCQYLLMFLSDAEIAAVLDEVNRITTVSGTLILELQDVKSGRPVRLDRVIKYLSLAANWRTVHKLKSRCMLQREC